ncbi:MAG: hypothetical protein ABH880_00455 [Patescibacteria group bacterium]
MAGLTYVSVGSEEDYIDLFTKKYGAPIKTPDCFTVECKYLRQTALHFLYGKKKSGKFQPARASRIYYAEYILENPNERKTLLDTQTGNLIFFFERAKGKIRYAVICSVLKDDNLNLISGFVVGGKRAEEYRDGKLPYTFYQKKKSC